MVPTKKNNKKNINEIADYKQGSLVGCSSSTVSKAFVITNSNDINLSPKSVEKRKLQNAICVWNKLEFRVSLLKNEG